MSRKFGVGAVLVLALLVLAVSRGNHRSGPIPARSEEAMTRALAGTSRWSPEARLAARLMVSRYGAPQRRSAHRLEWDARWPWRRISVDSRRPERPLEQVVDYYVPESRLPELAKFTHGLVVYADAGQLGARGDREEFNRLTLNLAHDIVTGRRNASQASRFYERTVQLSAAGKASPYLERLLFEVTPEDRLTQP